MKKIIKAIGEKSKSSASRTRAFFRWSPSKDIQNQKWFINRWEVMFIFAIAFVILIINMIPEWIRTDLRHVEITGQLTSYFGYPLKQSNWYQNFAMISTIILSLWILFFTEMGKYLGKYGSTIFIMLPSFIWLLQDRHVEKNAIIELSASDHRIKNIAFWVFIAVSVAFTLKILIKSTILAIKSRNRERDWKIFFFSSIFNRGFFILLNFIVIFLMASTLTSYGVFSLGVANDPLGDANPTADIKDKSAFFIAIVAVASAFLMILVGLARKFDYTMQKRIIAYQIKKENISSRQKVEINKKVRELKSAVSDREKTIRQFKHEKRSVINDPEFKTVTMEVSALKREIKKASKVKEKIEKDWGI